MFIKLGSHCLTHGSWLLLYFYDNAINDAEMEILQVLRPNFEALSFQQTTADVSGSITTDDGNENSPSEGCEPAREVKLVIVEVRVEDGVVHAEGIEDVPVGVFEDEGHDVFVVAFNPLL